MTELSLGRRLAVAAAGVACAAVLLRTQVGSSLITRGDDLARAGDVTGAVRAYTRATQFDSHSAAASDRLAFTLLMRRGRGDAARAFAIAGATLQVAPGDAALHADRGFAAERLGRWRDAERAFAAAADAARDPRYAHLAARMAQHSDDPAATRLHLHAALAIDPRYAPARAALHGLGG